MWGTCRHVRAGSMNFGLGQSQTRDLTTIRGDQGHFMLRIVHVHLKESQASSGSRVAVLPWRGRRPKRVNTTSTTSWSKRTVCVCVQVCVCTGDRQRDGEASPWASRGGLMADLQQHRRRPTTLAVLQPG